MTHELAARMTLAKAISADFDHEIRTARLVYWETWAHRLNTALNGLLAALDASTAPLLDGGAYVSGPDLMAILAALRDAAEYRANNPDDADRELIARFRGLSRTLGDDR
jgi:hypothetical protein